MKSCPALRIAVLCALTLTHPALHAAPTAASAPTVEFSTEAQQSAANDLVLAALYVERSGSDLAAVAAEVNRTLATALETAASHATVKARSGAMSSAPIHAREGGVRIEGWRMRAGIQLESRDLEAVSALIGKLQGRMALDHVTLQPAPETRRKASDAATVEAIHRFEQRAAQIATMLGKTYRIQHLSLSDNGAQPRLSSRMLAAPAAMGAALPLEGGESLIEVTAQGRIELLD